MHLSFLCNHCRHCVLGDQPQIVNSLDIRIYGCPDLQTTGQSVSPITTYYIHKQTNENIVKTSTVQPTRQILTSPNHRILRLSKFIVHETRLTTIAHYQPHTQRTKLLHCNLLNLSWQNTNANNNLKHWYLKTKRTIWPNPIRPPIIHPIFITGAFPHRGRFQRVTRAWYDKREVRPCCTEP